MGITFKYKDYRIQGPERYKLMTLATDEFIRRFLMHVLPKGFHRIRHSGLLANGSRADNLAKARALLNVPKPDAIPDDPKSADAAEPPTLSRPCPSCGGRMLIIETFAGDAGRSTGRPPRRSQSGSIRHDRDCIIYRDATPSVLAILAADR